jgi:uncharacterized protein (DUF433 family)
MTVYDVSPTLARECPPDEILEDFPFLTREDIQACLSFAADREHRTLVAL